ncbi:UvrD-helicase domain-containing protein [Caenimonas koreensis]|uniref:DNA 3'-5' helicase II n=1 Tax=Caenimonas koreensis DSM 17982 TaxID=1121255 RepID=A0A844AZ69_9BURK|nr:UvrD-helicase domain-containing protein [Caenimonas koreensis]MRD49645.1 AAA family ATPase [Caenimonas koreensis DSM 17982]
MLTLQPDEVQRGSVTAAAGCGKTQLIASCIGRHTDHRPILVLTHTLAGVAALKDRLRRIEVLGAAYRLMTLDAFAQWLVGAFPRRTQMDLRAMRVSGNPFDYTSVQQAAAQLIMDHHLDDLLPATYARLFVDEYQDCSVEQHGMVKAIARLVPTCVFGDEMQAIFTFGRAAPVDWDNDVVPCFPPIGELNDPWRWRKVGKEPFGRWLVGVRAQLKAGGGVDLTRAPAEVDWRTFTDASALAVRRKAAGCSVAKGSSVLVMGQSFSTSSQHRIARQTHGAHTAEASELDDLLNFAMQFEVGSAMALDALLALAASAVANANISHLKARLKSLKAKRAIKEANETEELVLQFDGSPTTQHAATLLEAIARQPKARVFRREIYFGVIAALRRCSERKCSVAEAIQQVRDGYRHAGRKVSGRVVGSTLLLKGLEADTAVVLYPEEMDAKNLYVAMTRGARRLVICSGASILIPKPAMGRPA